MKVSCAHLLLYPLVGNGHSGFWDGRSLVRNKIHCAYDETLSDMLIRIRSPTRVFNLEMAVVLVGLFCSPDSTECSFINYNPDCDFNKSCPGSGASL